MTITTRICAGGNRSLTRLPLPSATLAECLNANNRIDRVKAQLAFADAPEYFNASSKDNDAVYWATMTFLECLHDAFDEVCDDPLADCDRSEQNRMDAKLVQRIDRKCVYVRQRVNPTADGVSVRVEVSNPDGIVGQSLSEAEICAETFVQMWLRIIPQSKIAIHLVCDSVHLDNAREKNRRAEMRRKYSRCERRCVALAGEMPMCSPCKFDCPLFENGRCTYEN